MIKPEGFDNAPAYTGETEELPLGGHILKIKKAIDGKSKTGKRQLILLFDIDEGSESDGYYQRKFDAAKTRQDDPKWQGVFRQGMEGNSLPFFKGVLTSLEESNPGFHWNWDESTLIGKKVGGVFGREQFRASDGTLKWSVKCMSIRSVATIQKGVDVPDDKYLNGNSTAKKIDIEADVNGQLSDFQVIDGEDDLPF